MLKTRVIPCLLLRNRGLVKTVQFKEPKYVGDAINTVRIYNEQEVDELMFLDIMATNTKAEPQYKLLAEIMSECFMPFAYGGGISNIEQAERLFKLGIEKVVINSYSFESFALIEAISDRFGAQSVIGSIDVKKGLFGNYRVFSHSGEKKQSYNPVVFAKLLTQAGVGEILLTSINQDGMMKGYDLALIKEVSQAVSVPVVACGGAGKLEDFALAVEAGASAVAAGSMMVYQGENRAVLTQYPDRAKLERILG